MSLAQSYAFVMKKGSVKVLVEVGNIFQANKTVSSKKIFIPLQNKLFQYTQLEKDILFLGAVVIQSVGRASICSATFAPGPWTEFVALFSRHLHKIYCYQVENLQQISHTPISMNPIRLNGGGGITSTYRIVSSVQFSSVKLVVRPGSWIGVIQRIDD